MAQKLQINRRKSSLRKRDDAGYRPKASKKHTVTGRKQRIARKKGAEAIQKRRRKRKMTKRQFILKKKIELIDAMDDKTLRKFLSMSKKRQDQFIYKTLFADGYYKYRPEGGMDQIQRVSKIRYEDVKAADITVMQKLKERTAAKAVNKAAKAPMLTVAAARGMAKEEASEQLDTATAYVKRKTASEAVKASAVGGKYALTHAPVLDRFFMALSRLTAKASAWFAALLAPLAVPFIGIIITLMYFIMVLGAGTHAYYQQQTQHAALSAEVLAYYDTVVIYAEKHGIPDFVNLALAMMMQESGGRGTDPMMCSESPFNTRYPNTVGAIQDPEYSIDVGCQTLAYALNNAGCTDPADLDGIKLALQDYNFGNGYARWALNIYGGYSLENANEFAAIQAASHGWSSYGDVNYPDHVLRYYSYGGLTSGTPGANGWCWPTNVSTITDTYGYQDWRGGIHNGIDIGASMGSPIYAAAGGTVWIAGWSNSAGNWIVLEHGDGVKTVYMHASELYVSAGEAVHAGQVIAAVGSTGNSTGPHLHFGVMINSSYNSYDGTWVDPMLYVLPDS